jgi:hypothetical protein
MSNNTTRTINIYIKRIKTTISYPVLHKQEKIHSSLGTRNSALGTKFGIFAHNEGIHKIFSSRFVRNICNFRMQEVIQC